MSSQIDITKPVFGQPTTESVRENFRRASNEISVLQDKTFGAPFLSLQGGRMEGPMFLYNDPTDALHPVTLGWAQANFGTGGGGGGAITEAPADGQAYGRIMGAWTPVLRVIGGELEGPLTLAGDATEPLNPATKQQLDAVAGTIPPDSPDDGKTYGRKSGAWQEALSIDGGELEGPLTLAGDATEPLNPASLQQLAAAIAPYLVTNYVDNSGFTINQTNYPSGAALAANAYGFDRWKAGANGCTLVFTPSPPDTTVMITAGSLVQPIEGANLLARPYTLSWSGTAQGRVYNQSTVPDAYVESPIHFIASQGTNLLLEFSGGTLGRVQLQLGTKPTPWQPAPLQVDQARCDRFFQRIYVYIGGYGIAAANIGASSVQFRGPMRATPSVTLETWNYSNANGVNTGGISQTMWQPGLNITGNNVYFGANGWVRFSANL